MSDSRYGYEALAKIHHVKIGNEDHGIPTCLIYLRGESWGQGFGGIAHDSVDDAKAFAQSVATVFGCSVDGLTGQEALALRCFGGSGNIDAIRSTATGRTFSIEAWRARKGFPSDPLRAERDHLLQEHAFFLRRAVEMAEAIAALEGRYQKIDGEAP